ncbi:MAG: hypothetical protein DMG86_03820 [Acidobacteria bacterium]|nr:MAG: hypothetical protein DMG86_03820 [Acidobacteriota bacterium]
MGRTHQPSDCGDYWSVEQVVKNYLRTTFDKLGVWSRLELALYVARQGGAGWRDTRNLASESALQSDPSGVLPQSG